MISSSDQYQFLEGIISNQRIVNGQFGGNIVVYGASAVKAFGFVFREISGVNGRFRFTTKCDSASGRTRSIPGERSTIDGYVPSICVDSSTRAILLERIAIS